MSKLVWDKTGERFYETGVKNCVLYTYDMGYYTNGVAWNGVVSITENPSGAEATPLYADDIKYLNLMSAEEFGATIEAYTYPEEFVQCDGSISLAKGINIGQQPRKMFGLVYKTTLGNDVSGNELGYKLHLVYGCLAAPSEKAYASINDSPEATTFSWEISTTPVAVPGHKPTSHIVIDSTKVPAGFLSSLENGLFGVNGTPRLIPLPELMNMIRAYFRN